MARSSGARDSAPSREGLQFAQITDNSALTIALIILIMAFVLVLFALS